MNSSVLDAQEARSQAVSVSDDSLTIDLADGRTLIVPLVWYPRLWHGTPEERTNFEISADGTLIHWPDLDEDLSVSGILAGRHSGESQESLKKWLEERAPAAKHFQTSELELAVFQVEDHGFVEPTSWSDEYKRIFKLFETNLKRQVESAGLGGT